MPASVNLVVLMGNVTVDPDFQYLDGGRALCRFSIAVNQVFVSKGERKENTTFVRIVCWARTAEVCGEHLKKGDPVFVEGRLTSSQWQTEDGQKRSSMEVTAQRVQFVGGRRSEEERGGVKSSDVMSNSSLSGEGSEPAVTVADSDIPF